MSSHNYTFQELDEIARRASELQQDSITRYEVEAVLDSLPEEEQWEPVSVDETGKDDEIQVVGDGWHYEFTVKYPNADVICCHPMTGAQITKANHYQYELKFYRKVKPIVHPNPYDHPYLKDLSVHPESGYEGRTSYEFAVWNNGNRVYNLHADGVYWATVKPEEIIDFKVAKIVDA